MQFRALSIGEAVPHMNFDAVIQSTFDSAVNLRLANEDRLITLLISDGYELPQGIRIWTETLSLRPLSPGLRAATRGGILRFDSSPLTVDLRGAPVWKCRVPQLTLNMELLSAQQARSRTWDVLNAEQRIKSTDLVADDLFQTGTGSALSQRISKPVMSLVTSTDGFDVQGALHAARQLIGLGPGVTPSGDDLLLGFLAGLWSLAGQNERQLGFIHSFGMELIPLTQATSEISRTYLYHAAQGQFSSSLSHLAEAIATGDDVEEAARVAMHVGHSSGMDSVTGLLIGLCVWSPQSSRRSPRRLGCHPEFLNQGLLMTTSQRMIKNLYRDSVSLMQFSEKLRALDGIQQASAVMATENNISLLVEAGLLAGTVPPSPNDLLIVVEGRDEASTGAALESAEAMLKAKAADSGEGGVRRVPPRSLEMSLESMPSANFVLISTPGEYAAAEARKALQLGLHVMMFSDNVSMEAEIPLKQYARAHDLLVMGPDCGTAIINGVPLGFANVVRRGDIGVVAASGTGLQQVTSLIDRFGAGITQAIGTGGHDLKSEVGGITMLQGIEALAKDKATKVILLVSKPPSPDVMKNVLDKAAKSKKPVVVEFIGADPKTITSGNIHGVKTLEDAASAAVLLSKGKTVKKFSNALPARYKSLVKPAQKKLKKGQRYIRGLFSGGTFCYETVLLLSGALGKVYSNTPIKKDEAIPDVWKSLEHTVIDLGDDLFTQGRPHPMIDFRLRNERILQEAKDPETAVILLDVVLGYGSNMDPAGELMPAIQGAQKIAAKAKRNLVFVGSVCGTDSDPQNLSQQEARLREAGVILTDSNAQAARLAAAIVGAR